jgi:hypothetical protein
VNRRAEAAALNHQGLEHFAEGDPADAAQLLREAYKLLPEESGILVNLGLAWMQQGRPDLAERAYRLVIDRPETAVASRRSACKNLGFLKLWQGKFQEGWHWHGLRFAGETFDRQQWRGEPLNRRPLTVWNDVGMGDAFQFVRYTKPLVDRGERVIFAVDASQMALFQQHLAWPLEAVVDRRSIDRCSGAQIPLMSLIAVLDADTRWGRHFREPTFQVDGLNSPAPYLGLCWASNPGDRTMHVYKSSTPEQLLGALGEAGLGMPRQSLQTDEPEAHQRLQLMPPERDWRKTLHRIGSCQAVASVDTAVAHLAAGLGKPVTMLVNEPCDWRWRQFPDLQSLWYPSLRLQPLGLTG